MATLKRKSELIIESITIRGNLPFQYATKWQKKRLDPSKIVPVEWGIAYPGEVLVSEYDPRTGIQTYHKFESEDQLNEHFVHENDNENEVDVYDLRHPVAKNPTKGKNGYTYTSPKDDNIQVLFT